MSARKPTDEQIAAIEAMGETLVSASAGSGKTFVMIEKIISLILSGKAEVQSLLAVTFTKLAAEEMKGRLKQAVSAQILSETDKERRRFLKEQLNEIGASDISTLHSFCSGIIKRYFYKIGENGNFRVAEESEAQKLKKRAAETVFDGLLEQKDEKFLLLSKIFAGSRGFKKLADTVIEAHSQAAVSGDLVPFLRSVPEKYTEEGFARLSEEYFAPVRARAQRLARAAAREAENAETLAKSGSATQKYAEFCRSREQYAEKIASADLFTAARLAEERLPNKPANTKLKNAQDAEGLVLDERVSAFKTEVDAIKKALSSLESREEEAEKFFASGKVASALADVVEKFDEAYTKLKKRAGLLDFSDLERYCLALLRIDEVREEVRAKYDYLFVDEYQDVNPVQEQILSLIAGENVFMVGDVKQSIYGFRGCSAAFFADKYTKLLESGKALRLNGNFRSAPAVIGAVNTVFSESMTEESCKVNYRKDAKMIASGAYPENSGRVSFHLLPEKEEEEKEERDVYSVIANLGLGKRKQSVEGARIASIIAEELTKTRFDPRSGEYVPVDFKDIAVLTRNKTMKAERIVDELIACGIPVTSSAEYNICDYPEVKTMLDILRYIDNAEQDIPLAAALKSAAGGFSDSELASIRLFSPSATFCRACKEYAEKNNDKISEKLNAFYAFFEKLRLLSSVRSAAEIMAEILSETEMQIGLFSSPCGKEAYDRVMRLIAESKDLGVFDFLEKLKNGGYKVGFSESGGENAVKVMTMHASKGLEFPVVILAGMNDRFSGEDMKGSVLFDGEWGYALCAYDTENYLSQETLLRRFVKTELQKKRAEDEMRLLYVAMTRAEFSLHMVFSAEGNFDPENPADASCFADFIPIDKVSKFFEELKESNLTAFTEHELVLSETDELTKEEILRVYRRPYPFEESLSVPVKTSASALLKERGETFYPEKQLFEEELPAADKETGIAYHAFLEECMFDAPSDEDAKRALSRLSQRDPECALLVNEEKAKKILSMPVFEKIRGAELFKEREFLLTLPAKELYGGTSEDEVLVQGVIDLMAVKGKECILLDYKYSRMKKEFLLEKYAPQLKLYAAAAERGAGAEKVEAYLVDLLSEEIVRVL